jgi:SAM-dependent methyltransferase
VTGPLGCPCTGRFLVSAWTYDAPPEGETRFPFLDGGYRREVSACTACGHLVLDPGVGLEELYDGGYVDATYGNTMRATFAHITALAPEHSDNAGRVRRVVNFSAAHLTRAAAENRSPRALDVGSGLCVFGWALAQEGWDVLALDPDARAVEHARHIAGVIAVHGDFMRVEGLGHHDLVSLNKVLEHVADPLAMLMRARDCMAPGGVVYVEVPDGESARRVGPGRQEFFIEHLHAFSVASLGMLIERAGLTAVRIDRLHEPSGKLTLAAFCR